MRPKSSEIHIGHGVAEPLSKVPFHKDVEGIERLLLISPKMDPSAPLHIAVHQVKLGFDENAMNGLQYAEPHKHDFEEVNILWSELGKLKYKFKLDGCESIVESPAVVVIPSGVIHCAEALSGEGTFTCILLNG